jgi:predicted porin
MVIKKRSRIVVLKERSAPIRRKSLWFPLLGLLSLAGVSGPASASLLSANYQLNWDQTVDKTETGTTDVKKLKQSVELKYVGYLSPVVANSVSFKVEQEVNSDAPDVIRLLPILELGFKGKYWDAKAGAKRTDENTDEPGKNPKKTDNYYIEFFYLAPKSVPDVKAKYTIDLDTESGTTDTRKDGVTLSSVYAPTGWLSAKGDYTRNTLKDNLKADSDTEDEKSTGTVGLRHVLFSDKLKVETQYTTEVSRAATLKSDGSGAVDGSAKEDLTNTWKNLLGFRPFRDTSVDGSYDFDLKQNKVTGEHTLTTNIKAAASQKVGAPFDLRGDFSRAITEMRHTADDNKKTEDTWTAEAKAKFSKQLDFSVKYQKKDTVEDHVDPSKNTTSGSVNRNANWIGDLTPFWTAALSYDKTDTLALDVTTIVEEKYSLKSRFDFKEINLTLEPTYDITLKDDLVKPESSDIRDFKTRLAYLVLKTRTIEAKFDHTYGRKTDSLLANIQRTDTTNANVLWKDPVPGWQFSFDAVRSATDTSGDDLAPDITSTFGVKADFKKDQLALSTSYKYDKKSLSDNTENFDAKAGWIAPRWDASITYTFKKTFSDVINEGYTISLTFKYNL